MTLISERSIPGESIINIDPGIAVTERDHEIADMIGMSRDELDQVLAVRAYPLGELAVDGQVATLVRFHSGTTDYAARGGSKVKFYEQSSKMWQDGIDHCVAMNYKIGAMLDAEAVLSEQSPYEVGGKTIISYNNRYGTKEEQAERMDELLYGYAHLMVEAGLADPKKAFTAGDEGTNELIGKSYLRGLQDHGVKYARALVTGKDDMPVRGPATGRGAVIALRETMRLNGQEEAGFVVQGAGAAGLEAVAECYDPVVLSDAEVKLPVRALGDIDQNYNPITLTTDDPRGLEINHAMAKKILTTGGNKLATAQNLLKEKGITSSIKHQDVLTYESDQDKLMYLAPAATSGVFHEGNIGQVKIKNIAEIGNHTVVDSVRKKMTDLGFVIYAGEKLNLGGCFISREESYRDIDHIKAEDAGQGYVAPSDAHFNKLLYKTMVGMSDKAYKISREMGVDDYAAVRVMSLGNRAVIEGISIDPRVRGYMV